LQLVWVEAAQPVAEALLKKLALVLQVPLVRVPHYSLALEQVLLLEQLLKAHCLLSDVALHSVQEQVPVQQDHLQLA
jgi:hypothetical protein